jgi:hypothetical protein
MGLVLAYLDDTCIRIGYAVLESHLAGKHQIPKRVREDRAHYLSALPTIYLLNPRRCFCIQPPVNPSPAANEAFGFPISAGLKCGISRAVQRKGHRQVSEGMALSVRESLAQSAR